MNTPQKQMLVFTSLDGYMIDPSVEGIQTILPALELLHGREVPHIAVTVRSAVEIAPILEALDHDDPFIVESGAAIYLPAERFKINFSYQNSDDKFKIVEFGLARAAILEKLPILRDQYHLDVWSLSELNQDQAAQIIGLSAEEIERVKNRKYTEPIIFNGSGDEIPQLQAAVESLRMHLSRHDRYFVLTGDHNSGGAVSFLLQLYREEFPNTTLISIGLGDGILSAPMLHTVDTPVLVRLPGGHFDDRVGRHGMKFTRESGPVGWNQAVIALVTEDPDA
jgi:mannosyl-3-phosphoglycerate phosphatase family protein